MSEFGWLAVYCGAILIVSLCGGSVPFVRKVTHSRLQIYLSVSAGVMLGASFFHVMPDAIEKAGPTAVGWWMALAVIGLFCIERFLAPHSHETDSQLQQDHKHEPGCEHDHQHRAAPAVAGWMTVVGLTIHTFMNGFGLAGSVSSDMHQSAAVGLPGLAMFLAIALHKPADALAISTVLWRKGVPKGRLALVQIGFALTIPLGAAAFIRAEKIIASDLANQLTGAALAFSAGTFLFIALSDLLPEVQFHRHDRVPLALALIAGVLFMGGIGYLEDLGHGEHSDEAAPAIHHHNEK